MAILDHGRLVANATTDDLLNGDSVAYEVCSPRHDLWQQCQVRPTAETRYTDAAWVGFLVSGVAEGQGMCLEVYARC
jgi:hypothetical protein